MPKSSGGRVRSFPSRHYEHNGSPRLHITRGMDNRPAGGHGSETCLTPSIWSWSSSNFARGRWEKNNCKFSHCSESANRMLVSLSFEGSSSIWPCQRAGSTVLLLALFLLRSVSEIITRAERLTTARWCVPYRNNTLVFQTASLQCYKLHWPLDVDVFFFFH
jgi:hypothetical protein